MKRLLKILAAAFIIFTIFLCTFFIIKATNVSPQTADVFNYLIGINKEAPIGADANNDGEVNILDIIILLKQEQDDTTDTSPSQSPSTMELMSVGELQYYLYTPSSPTENMPLIIYLHGGTNKKADVTALLTTEGFPKYLYDGYYGDLRAYIAIPKLDNSYKGWADIYEQIRTLIKELNTTCCVDMKKIALTGHSMGGTGTYQLQLKMPNTFACIAPLSGSVKNTEDNVELLKKTKIWAFVGTEDTVVEPESTIEIIEALQAVGADAALTKLEGATHFDVPALAYKNPQLIQWLINCGN